MSDLMSNTSIIFIASIGGVCVVIAVVVWLRVRSINKAEGRHLATICHLYVTGIFCRPKCKKADQ